MTILIDRLEEYLPSIFLAGGAGGPGLGLSRDGGGGALILGTLPPLMLPLLGGGGGRVLGIVGLALPPPRPDGGGGGILKLGRSSVLCRNT